MIGQCNKNTQGIILGQCCVYDLERSSGWNYMVGELVSLNLITISVRASHTTLARVPLTYFILLHKATPFLSKLTRIVTSYHIRKSPKSRLGLLIPHLRVNLGNMDARVIQCLADHFLFLPPAYLGAAIQQLIDKAIAPTGVIDIFQAVGLQKPDLSILSEAFLAEVRALPQRNLAVEMLERLLGEEIKLKAQKNLIESRAFSEKLLAALNKYQNRAIETAQVIEELIALARELRESRNRGEKLGLGEDELAFYDALEANDSAVQVMGDEALRTIARELAETVRKNTTIDWSVREQVRAHLRRMVKRVLRKYGYPPDKQEGAALKVIEQAQQMAKFNPQYGQ